MKITSPYIFTLSFAKKAKGNVWCKKWLTPSNEAKSHNHRQQIKKHCSLFAKCFNPMGNANIQKGFYFLSAFAVLKEIASHFEKKLNMYAHI